MPNLLDDCYISFVNLAHRKDRLTRMWASLNKVGINAVRTPGMLPSEYRGDKEKVAVMQNRTPGAIGCHYSQVKVMEEAYRRGKHAFVMEDDLIFCEDLPKRIAIMEGFIETHEWDILWMGGTFHINPPFWHKKLGRDAELTNHSRMVRTYGAFCTYAYIVNYTSLTKVLWMLEELVPTSMGIDWAMIQMQPKLFTYAFVPGCITQYDNKSDIGKGMTIFSGFAKLNGTIQNSAYWYQDRMENFDPRKFDWHEAWVNR